jgi:hypothetical protein
MPTEKKGNEVWEISVVEFGTEHYKKSLAEGVRSR